MSFIIMLKASNAKKELKKQNYGVLPRDNQGKEPFNITYLEIFIINNQGPDFDMSSFFPCQIHDGIQYIHLGYGVKAPKIVIL